MGARAIADEFAMHVDKLIPEKVELTTATAVDTVARATAKESPLAT